MKQMTISISDGSLADSVLVITVLRPTAVLEVRWGQEAQEVLSPTTALLLHRTVTTVYNYLFFSLFFFCFFIIMFLHPSRDANG